ncbi:MAG TPA: MFS transporter [Nocardioides sp.]|jgi:MFS family permease|uniref:MFS transporter n=1 Tax=Nocardioides sp. TaxID=35761 RepID=UPI002E376C42|nr:MFS transporter [Nocardioides sp.]HEX3930547.1 MFS transporter [Nocardioides sp.]
MFTRYRSVLTFRGAWRFSLAAFVARLPISISTLGIVLLVTGLGRSYGLAGALSASYTIANGLSSVVQGRLLDRLGQSVVLPVVTGVYAIGLVGLVTATQSHSPAVLAFGAAFVAGVAYPPIGSVVRARWSHVLTGRPSDVQTAYALESVVDELIFVIGPTVATVLATQWHPWAGLGLALVTGVPGLLVLAALRDSQPVPLQGRQQSGPRPAMPWLPVLVLAGVSFALGSMFAAAEVATVAFSAEQHAKSLAGVLLACWSAGSMVAGLATGTLSWRRSATTRVRVGSFLLALVMVPMSFVGSMAVMGVTLFVAGFAIAPTLIAIFSAIEQGVPAARLTEGIALSHTGLAAGLAPGAGLAGWVIDAHGASPSYLVALGGGVVAALASLALPSSFTAAASAHGTAHDVPVV